MRLDGDQNSDIEQHHKNNQHTEKKAKGRTAESKGSQGKSQLGEPLAGYKCRMLNTRKVCVPGHHQIKDTDERGNRRRRRDFSPQVLVNTRTKERRNVVEEAILRTVLSPVVVRVDRATVFARFFAIGNVLDWRQRRGYFGIAVDCHKRTANASKGIRSKSCGHATGSHHQEGGDESKDGAGTHCYHDGHETRKFEIQKVLLFVNSDVLDVMQMTNCTTRIQHEYRFLTSNDDCVRHSGVMESRTTGKSDDDCVRHSGVAESRTTACRGESIVRLPVLR